MTELFTRPSAILSELGVPLVGELDVDAAPATEVMSLGRFQLLEAPRRHAMGASVEARDPDLLRRVVVRVLVNPERIARAQLERFVAEARLTAQLEHPGIAPVYDMGVGDNGWIFVVMRRICGQTLRERLDDGRGCQERPGLLGAVARVCRTVAFAHDRGVAHRALCADNILLGRFGEVLVLDWGRAARESAAAVRADVRALGGIVSDVLTGSAAPDGEMAVPEELADLEAVAREAETGAASLAERLESFLDGRWRRTKAEALVADARRIGPEIEGLRGEAKRLGARATAALAEDRASAWADEDAAAARESTAELREAEQLRTARAALALCPDQIEAKAILVDGWLEQHRRAERRRDRRAVASLERRIRTHARGRDAAYLRGDGALTLLTDPPEATAELFRYVVQDRRLVPERVGNLRTTPLRAVVLPMGSYLVRLRAAGHMEARYPVYISRQHHWHGVAPGETAPRPVPLARIGALDDDEIYVPAGWFDVGGDAEAPGSCPLQRGWLDGFAIGRFPVTRRAFEAFRDRIGHELVAPSDAGHPDEPAAGVDWHAATAYARWLGALTGRAYRLPGELEWEKAARGVDGRAFPWGDHADPAWYLMQRSHLGPPGRAMVQEFPEDEGPYGLRGAAGNVRDWCADVYRPTGPLTSDQVSDRVSEHGPGSSIVAEPHRVFRGGAWNDVADGCRLACRYGADPSRKTRIVGFRLARSGPFGIGRPE